MGGAGSQGKRRLLTQLSSGAENGIRGASKEEAAERRETETEHRRPLHLSVGKEPGS